MLGGVFWTLESLRPSEIDREVIKTYCGNGTLLRRSLQLLLGPESHHLEGSVHLEVTDAESRTRLENVSKMITVW